MSPREYIAEVAEDALLLEPDTFDRAIVGLAERAGGMCVVAYSREKCIEVLMDDGCTEEEAVEHFEFNTLGAWAGDGTPVFITELRDE